MVGALLHPMAQAAFQTDKDVFGEQLASMATK